MGESVMADYGRGEAVFDDNGPAEKAHRSMMEQGSAELARRVIAYHFVHHPKQARRMFGGGW
jgi:hypothetical protein